MSSAENTEEIEGEGENADSVDREFYNRQLYVLGKEAMTKMQGATICIVGLGGLGQEVAKNMILTGVRACYLCDDEVVSHNDLSSSFYFKPEEIGKNRVEACITDLKELNGYVKVTQIRRADLTADFLKKIKVLCFTDSPILSLVEMNKLCRETDTRMIACESRGLFGALFCDMGKKEFLVFDDNGEAVVENTIVHITNEKEAMVTVHDEDRTNHGMGKGDTVMFENVGGMVQLNEMEPIEIDIGEGTTKYTFRIKCDTTGFPQYKSGSGYCKQVKPPKKMQFLSLEESIEKPEVLEYDYGKWDFGKNVCHPLHRASFDFLTENKRLPKPYNIEDANKLVELANKYYVPEKPGDEESEAAKKRREDKETKIQDFFRLYSYTCRGQINPMACMIGGFCAQEIQKAVSGKYTPLKQWFYIDAFECLKREEILESCGLKIEAGQAHPKEAESQPKGDRYDGNVQVFGSTFQEKLKKQKIFIVGCGALGCEYLKNFALLGVACSPEGELRATDMDSIEVSNLNRQFLFRGHHVGKEKSLCACKVAKTMNTDLNLKPMTDKVCPDAVEVFNDEFWSSLDCVVNALDNIKARLYVDSRCLYYGKPLIEAGTLGPKANTQTVIPFTTENYGAQRDPPEKDIAGCTEKYFPYLIPHTIKWAMTKFSKYFKQDPMDVNAYINNENYYDELKRNNNSAFVLNTMTEIHRALCVEKPKSFIECIVWARLRFEEHFVNDLKQLLHTFPLDAKTSHGLPFWGGAKRPPTPFWNLDAKDIPIPQEKLMKDFVIAAACIRADVYGIPRPEDIEKFAWDEEIKKVKIPEFVPQSDVKIETGEEEEEAQQPVVGDDDEEKIKEILQKLPKPNELQNSKLNVISFEKDDDKNKHIDYVTAFSNSRACNYNIPPADRIKTKGIAGKIIPAMVTTTAMITGFGMIEYLKTVAGKTDIESFRNAYVNLALPSCTMSEPMPPKKQKYYDIEFTAWDSLDVDLGKDVTITELIEHFKEKHKLVVSLINYGPAMIYCNYMPGGEDDVGRLVADVCFDITKSKPKKGQIFLDIVILADGINDEEFENLPDVKYKFRGW